ncbi:MAG: N-acetylmuramidase family protein [Bacteroides sp.]|nr:N-acetylmuramidase family protein [Bacteroides sp.]
MSRRLAIPVVALLLTAGCVAGCAQKSAAKVKADDAVRVVIDSIAAGMDESDRYTHLTDADFRKVARELGVEVAAIKAVVLIEAGAGMKGFWAPGVPVINFDRSMYGIYAGKAQSKAGDKKAKVPSGLTGYPQREWTQLTNARRINRQGADMGTFWGMFQIGGFNYKLCGCQSVEEFVSLMSYSELEQLELFATFLINTGYVKDLRAKNWAAFARKYNGPSYAKRGYHTKMANAYARFKKEDSGKK